MDVVLLSVLRLETTDSSLGVVAATGRSKESRCPFDGSALARCTCRDCVDETGWAVDGNGRRGWLGTAVVVEGLVGDAEDTLFGDALRVDTETGDVCG